MSRLVSLSLAALFVLSLSSCGRYEDESSQTVYCPGCLPTTTDTSSDLVGDQTQPDSDVIDSVPDTSDVDVADNHDTRPDSDPDTADTADDDGAEWPDGDEELGDVDWLDVPFDLNEVETVDTPEECSEAVLLQVYDCAPISTGYVDEIGDGTIPTLARMITPVLVCLDNTTTIKIGMTPAACSGNIKSAFPFQVVIHTPSTSDEEEPFVLGDPPSEPNHLLKFDQSLVNREKNILYLHVVR